MHFFSNYWNIVESGVKRHNSTTPTKIWDGNEYPYCVKTSYRTYFKKICSKKNCMLVCIIISLCLCLMQINLHFYLLMRICDEISIKWKQIYRKFFITSIVCALSVSFFHIVIYCKTWNQTWKGWSLGKGDSNLYIWNWFSWMSLNKCRLWKQQTGVKEIMFIKI
jgi:hypothetical protein